MGYNKITLYGNQTCDYLYVSRSHINNNDIKEVGSEPKEWTDETLMLAKFNNNLVAGDSAIAESIVGYEIRRKTGDNAYAEYVTTIEDTSDNLNKKFVIDYAAPNNTSCEYYLYPSSKNSMVGVTLSPIVSNEIKPIWSYWSLIIVDESEKENLYYVNKIFKFELNLKTGDMNNNAVVSINQNFTKYPTVQYGSSNYWSGSLTALCGFVSCSDHGYIQTPNMIDELKSLTSDGRKKFLKDIQGNIWEVKITSPISIATEDSTQDRVKTVTLSWTEVGDISGVSIVNNPNMETTSWLLTDTGEAIPYVEYIWDEHYKWNDSYKWTSKNNYLDIDATNLGRDLVTEGGESI